MRPGDEQGVGVGDRHVLPHRQPVPDGLDTGVVEVQHPLLVALAQHPELVAPDVAQIQPHQLRDPQPAVQEKGQDAVVTLPVGTVHVVQQGHALFQIQVFGQGFP